MRIRDFRAIKDVTLALSPFQVIIGENNTGKTSLLDALVMLSRLATSPPERAFTGRFDFERNVRAGASPEVMSWEVELSTGARWSMAASRGANRAVEHERFETSDGVVFERGWAGDKWEGTSYNDKLEPGWNVLRLTTDPKALSARRTLESIGRFVLEPRAMVVAAPPGSEMQELGKGLPGLLDWIQNTMPDRFQRIEETVRELFPRVRFVRMPPTASGERELAIVESGAPGLLYGPQLSDGLVLLLGYLTIVHGIQPSLLLLDEPEIGLHIARSRFLVDLLRKLSQGAFGPPVQVLLTTHSPDIVDFLEPEELIVVDRDEAGSVTLHPLRDVPDLKKRLRGYHLGEYWSSYGERGLLHGDET